MVNRIDLVKADLASLLRQFDKDTRYLDIIKSDGTMLYSYTLIKDNKTLLMNYHTNNGLITIKNSSRKLLFKIKVNDSFSYKRLYAFLDNYFDSLTVHIDYQDFDVNNNNYDIFHPELGLTDANGFMEFIKQFKEVVKHKRNIRISTSLQLVGIYISAMNRFTLNEGDPIIPTLDVDIIKVSKLTSSTNKISRGCMIFNDEDAIIINLNNLELYTD